MDKKNLQIRIPRPDLLETLYSVSVLPGESIINELSVEELQEYMVGKFDISVNNLNSTLLTSIFYDYLNFIANRHVTDRLFILPIDKIIKSKANLDSDIILYMNNILQDLNKNIPGNYNVIGGKIADLLDGVSFKDSIGDFDIWLTGIEYQELNRVNKRLGNYIASNYVIDENKCRENCITFYHKDHTETVINLQIIVNSQFVNVNDIFSKFDFLHCCVGYDGKNIFWRHGALKSIKQKNIVVNGLYPSRVLHERIIKYINRGYKINYPNFILCALSALLGVLNAPEIQSSLIRNTTYDSPVWTSYRTNMDQYEAILNDEF